MIKKNDRYKVKVRAIVGISEYLHGLVGIVVDAKKESIFKRLKSHGWNPVKIGSQTIFLVDFNQNRSKKLDPKSSKKFWFTAGQIAKVRG